MKSNIAIFILLLHLHVVARRFTRRASAATKPGRLQHGPRLSGPDGAQTCRLDLSAELFGGVAAACGRNLDRSRCCPVLAAWLFAAHATSALQVTAAAPPAGSELPMMPDDSQSCVNTLQSSLIGRNIRIPTAERDVRRRFITSLRCPAAFNVTGNRRNATPTAAVRNLEHNCKNSSYAGCTKCLGALQKLKVEGKNRTKGEVDGVGDGSDRASKMLSRDCQLMGLTWLLARNKTAYIPTVSAVLRAIMYSAHPPHESTCSPDQENMPLAVDSLQFERYDSSSATTFIPILPLIILSYLFV
ncbi:uncharacterized GPI-anchored protein at4g28100 [Phtheirospermum japonicum]|uniref:Uncharacterized GPI-anchored protein at4g28100 n=1 Tax=Phtheirospermum japonicum TaxID=374723 RepID=A0A830BZ86_9LAMI|nr:uncharacterized GPI-anchored protein at4g28100 [Phtheirospermum japonicum]